MSLHPRLATAVTTIAGLTMGLSACSGGATTPTPPSPAPTSAPAASPAGSTAATPTPSASSSPSGAAPTVSKNNLTPALLTVKDLPPGYETAKVETIRPFSSADKKCQPLLDAANDTSSGQPAGVGVAVAFSTSTGGVIELLDARRSSAEVGADLKAVRKSAQDCSRVMLTIPSRGKVLGKVSVKKSSLGDDSVLVEMSFSNGPRSLTLPLTAVRLGSVELRTLSIDPRDTSAVTKTAVKKAQRQLPG